MAIGIDQAKIFLDLMHASSLLMFGSGPLALSRIAPPISSKQMKATVRLCVCICLDDQELIIPPLVMKNLVGQSGIIADDGK